MTFSIHRPRQAIGLIYILIYLVLFFIHAIIQSGDQSWSIDPKFTAAVILWFVLSLGVKVCMFVDRTIELLNLTALVAVLSIGFMYIPHPGQFSSIEHFCYYLTLFGGSACDFFDFLYESAARRSEDKL